MIYCKKKTIKKNPQNRGITKPRSEDESRMLMTFYFLELLKIQACLSFPYDYDWGFSFYALLNGDSMTTCKLMSNKIFAYT